MPKTRQQRLAEERAGQPPSPPQSLEDKPRAPKRTRTKTPSATEVAGPVVPATQSIPSGESQALVRIWVGVGPGDSGQPVGDFTHQKTIPSSRVPELVTFLENNCNQEKDKEMVEAIPPVNQTASLPPKTKKRAFRRNPMGATSSIFEPQPVTASLDTSTTEGISSPQVGPPETPQRSKWNIGNLFQPGSIKKLLGFSPLAPVSESTESLPQFSPLAPVSESLESLPQFSPLAPDSESLEPLPQTLTAEPASTEPKIKRSIQSSAKDARAKHRRHNDSITKPVKHTTTSKNQRDRLSRAREVNLACGTTATTGVEGEQFLDIRPTDRAQREVRPLGVGGPGPEPTIRWPSRSLDRINQNKRKHWDKPVAISSPDRGSYGPGEADLRGNKEGYGVGEEPPGKIRRTSRSGIITSRFVIGDPNPARPYEYQGTNVFAEYEAAQKATSSGMKQSPSTKTPIPITNSTGTFKVPSPGDPDWSDSGSEEEEGIQRIPPPLTQSEALRKAREKLSKYKPRNPSKLIQSSRAYQSPPSVNETAAKRGSAGPQAASVEIEQSTAVDLQRTGRTGSFTAFEDWCKTAPPAVTAALETMEVDSNMAGDAFARGLRLGDMGTSRSTNRYAAFDEWSRTAPSSVTAVLEKMEVDADFAGQVFQSGLDSFTKS